MGAKIASKRLTRRLEAKSVPPVFIEPGSPWENGFVESFHRKPRDECLNEEIFWSRVEARVRLPVFSGNIESREVIVNARLNSVEERPSFSSALSEGQVKLFPSSDDRQRE